jgi:hypothetical protein
MSIFDFGKKQRMHTQLIGNTSGKEMFKVDEYNKIITTCVKVVQVLKIKLLKGIKLAFKKIQKAFEEDYKPISKPQRKDYYSIGLKEIPFEVLKGWKKRLSKKNFKKFVKQSGYKFVHGG